MFKKGRSRLIRFYQNHKFDIQVTILMLMLAIPLMSAAAQTAVPPELDIPVDDMIGYINTWINSLGPVILFIGMIPVAVGFLRYIINMFKSAFGGS